MREGNSNVKEFDIEVFPNYFEVGIKDFRTKEVINLEISEEFDDRQKIYDFFSKYKGFLISFNGIHYDEVIIKYFLKDWQKLKNLKKEDLLQRIKICSDKVINTDLNRDFLKSYIYFKTNWISIDLYLFWAKMLRISKKISLKSLGIQMNYPVVMELPYNPETILNLEQIRQVREYNNIHDLGILDLLAEKQKGEITLRKNIWKDTGIQCMSYDAIKIASESLLEDYCKEKWNNGEVSNMSEGYETFVKNTRYLRFDKPTIYIKEILHDFNPNFKLPVFQKLYERILNSVNEFSEEVPIIEKNTTIRLSYGIGGLHSVNENELYDTTSTHKIMTSDVASLYPNLIINYRCIRFPEVLRRYTSIKDERIIAKKARQKAKDIFFKLILNGVSGLLDQQHSWLYFPEGALRLRLIGQLILTKAVELCILNNWQVISVNTDGIEAIVPVNEQKKYKEVFKEIEEQFNLNFEHEEYKFIYYKNVNNYIALTEKNKAKRKGLFKLLKDEEGKDEIPLGDSTNETVIAEALNNFFVKGIPIEETITNPNKFNFNIFHYTCAKKISKDYGVYYENEQIQNLNRYYFSRPAAYLLKKKKSSAKKYKATATFEHVNASNPVLLYNNHKEKCWEEYKIDYSHYIADTRKIIQEMQAPKMQLSLF